MQDNLNSFTLEAPSLQQTVICLEAFRYPSLNLKIPLEETSFFQQQERFSQGLDQSRPREPLDPYLRIKLGWNLEQKDFRVHHPVTCYIKDPWLSRSAKFKRPRVTSLLYKSPQTKPPYSELSSPCSIFHNLSRIATTCLNNIHRIAEIHP